MLDLSLVSPERRQDLETAIEQIRRIRGYRRDGKEKPHKLVLLLAVLDLIEDGIISDNRIYLSLELEERFSRYFALVANEGDWCQVSLPFFHLRSSGFWFHKIKPHREATYSGMRTPWGGRRNITKNIEFAYLSERLFSIMQDSAARKVLKRVLADRLVECSKNPAARFLREGLYDDASAR